MKIPIHILIAFIAVFLVSNIWQFSVGKKADRETKRELDSLALVNEQLIFTLQEKQESNRVLIERNQTLLLEQDSLLAISNKPVIEYIRVPVVRYSDPEIDSVLLTLYP